MKTKKGIILTAATAVFCVAIITSVIISKASNSKESEAVNEAVNADLITQDGYYEGELELSEEDEEWVEDNIIPIETEQEINELLDESQSSGDVDNIDIEKDDGRSPNEVDNSNSIYFPEIMSQGSVGSCVAWSVGYYQFSYMYNRAVGRTSANQSNLSSPAWTYNMTNNGSDGGATYVDVLKVLKDIGSVSLKKIPYNTGATNFTTDIHASEENFMEAFNYQIAGYYSVDIGGADAYSNTTPITGPNDTDLDAIKKGLDKGEIFTASTKSKRWIYSQIEANPQVPENDYYIGQYIITRSDANVTSGHRITVVGYNDDIWVDINENGIVEEGEKGAFKIANSWGVDWSKGNDGFIWASYDSLNFRSCVSDTSSIDLGSTYRYATIYQVVGMLIKGEQEPSDCYMKFTLNTSDIGAVNVTVNATAKDGKAYEYNAVPFKNSELMLSMGTYSPNGGSEACDGTFMIDLDNVVESVTPDTINDYSWSISFCDIYSDDVLLGIKDVQLVDSYNNKSYKTVDTSEVSINNTTRNMSINNGIQNVTTIYYKGYDNCYIHYKVGDGSWTSAPGMKMDLSSEMDGYTHKYVINMGSTSELIACFNNGSGTWDNNNSANYSLGVGTYGIKDRTVKKISTNIPDVTTTPSPSTPSPTPKVTTTPTPATPTPSTQNSTTIYYSGYSSPYIHYKVGDGSWTDAPGVKMIQTSEMNGYTHKYVINMVTSTTVTVCFNDGNGNWDSNNGSNYSFGLGTYTYSNGSIKKISTDLITASPIPATTAPATTKPATTKPATTAPATTKPAEDLDANISFSGSIKIGGDISIKASANGGTAPYTCTVGYVYNDESDVIIADGIILKNSSSSYTVSFMPNRGGKYNFYVRICDADGNEISKGNTYEIASFAITGITTSVASPQYLGIDVGLLPVYQDYYMRDNSKPDVTFSITDGTDTTELVYDGDSGDSVIWNPNKTGEYTITATSEDYYGQTASYQIKYTIREYNIQNNVCTIYYKGYSTPYIHYKVDGGSWTKAPGVKMETSSKMDGYTHRITINMGSAQSLMACFNDGKGTWDSNNGSNYTFKVGTYKYSNGTIKSANDTANNLTLYYKGYSSPYIHYRIGSGSWTAAPGIAMTVSNEMEGYTHMIIIDMAEDTTVTACFNNGSGEWDSNNGSNYSFVNGTYTYSGGKITAVN